MVEQGQLDVHAVVRGKLIAGTLPREAPVKVWAGPGTGRACSACDLTVGATVIEYETDMRDGRRLVFHQPCLAVWHIERARLLARADSVGDDDRLGDEAAALSEEELTVLLRVCHDHHVMYCLTCRRPYKLIELGSDVATGRRVLRCARCGGSTDNALRAHLISCPNVLAEEAAGRADVVKKVTRTLVDRSRLMSAESADRAQRVRGAPNPHADTDL